MGIIDSHAIRYSSPEYRYKMRSFQNFTYKVQSLFFSLPWSRKFQIRPKHCVS